MTPPRRWPAVLAITVALAVAAIRPATATPLPIELERDHVTVRAEAGLESVAEQVATTSQHHLDQIAEDLPDLPVPRHVEIRIVSEASEMQSVAPGTVPTWAAGVAFPELGVVVVATRRGSKQIDVGEVVHHELAHLALGAALGPRAPRWLHEGFAYQHSAEWTWERTETLAGLAWSGNIIPLEDLDRGFPAEHLPADRAYAQSYDFVGYLARRGRWQDVEDDGDRWPFRKFLGYLARGDDSNVAASHAFGRPLNELFDEWRQDLSRRFVLIPAGVFGALIWIFAAVLLALAFLRRRRMNRVRLAEWERLDAESAARQAAWLASLDADLPDGDEPRPTTTAMN